MSYALLGRVASLLVALTYLGVAAMSGGWGNLLGFSVVLSFPLACIWFPDELGELATIRMHSTSSSPGWLVAAGGWLLLIGPLWFAFWG